MAKNAAAVAGCRPARAGAADISPATTNQALEGRAVLCSEGRAAFVNVRQAGGAGGPPAKLSQREREVIQLLARNLTYGEIALRLRTETSTVNEYAKRAYSKLGVHSPAEAFRASRLRARGCNPQRVPNL